MSDKGLPVVFLSAATIGHFVLPDTNNVAVHAGALFGIGLGTGFASNIGGTIGKTAGSLTDAFSKRDLYKPQTKGYYIGKATGAVAGFATSYHYISNLV